MGAGRDHRLARRYPINTYIKETPDAGAQPEHHGGEKPRKSGGKGGVVGHGGGTIAERVGLKVKPWMLGRLFLTLRSCHQTVLQEVKEEAEQILEGAMSRGAFALRPEFSNEGFASR